jgi:histidinol phosphatase-like enzyme
MSRPAIFLERDGIITKPLPCLYERSEQRWYVPPLLEQCLLFWPQFPTEKLMWKEASRPWHAFWKQAKKLKEAVEARIRVKEAELTTRNRFGTVPKWWSDKSDRLKWRGAVLGITGDELGNAVHGDGLFYPDALPVLDDMDRKGFLTFFATNQGYWVDRGVPVETVQAYHWYVTSWLRAIGLQIGGTGHTFICLHTRDQRCDCRKPKSKLLREAVPMHDLDEARSWLIDTEESHEQAAEGAGMRFRLFDTSLAEIWGHIQKKAAEKG